jgi:hypothetical protein
MAALNVDRLVSALESCRFGAGSSVWDLVVSGVQDTQGEWFLHAILVGDPLLTLTIQIAIDQDMSIVTRRIGDGIVSWLATGDPANHAFLDFAQQFMGRPYPEETSA